MSRRPPKGFATWREYNAYRKERLTAMGFSERQAMGRPAPGEPLASEVTKRVQILGPGGPKVVEVAGPRERRRAGKYDSDIDQLLSGRLTRKEFDKRWGRRSIGGLGLPNADEILSLRHRGMAEITDFYVRDAERT